MSLIRCVKSFPYDDSETSMNEYVERRFTNWKSVKAIWLNNTLIRNFRFCHFALKGRLQQMRQHWQEGKSKTKAILYKQHKQEYDIVS